MGYCLLFSAPLQTYITIGYYRDDQLMLSGFGVITQQNVPWWIFVIMVRVCHIQYLKKIVLFSAWIPWYPGIQQWLKVLGLSALFDIFLCINRVFSLYHTGAQWFIIMPAGRGVGLLDVLVRYGVVASRNAKFAYIFLWLTISKCFKYFVRKVYLWCST